MPDFIHLTYLRLDQKHLFWTCLPRSGSRSWTTSHKITLFPQTPKESMCSQNFDSENRSPLGSPGPVHAPYSPLGSSMAMIGCFGPAGTLSGPFLSRTAQLVLSFAFLVLETRPSVRFVPKSAICLSSPFGWRARER